MKSKITETEQRKDSEVENLSVEELEHRLQRLSDQLRCDGVLNSTDKNIRYYFSGYTPLSLTMKQIIVDRSSSANKLGACIGVSRDLIERIMSGTRTPSVAFMKKCKDVFTEEEYLLLCSSLYKTLKMIHNYTGEQISLQHAPGRYSLLISRLKKTVREHIVQMGLPLAQDEGGQLAHLDQNAIEILLQNEDWGDVEKQAIRDTINRIVAIESFLGNM